MTDREPPFDPGVSPRQNGARSVRSPEPRVARPAPPQERDRGELERDLLRLENGVDDLDRPYLTALPEDFSGEELVFEWLNYLCREAGLKRALEAVEYYREIGWIGSDVETTLREYLLGLELSVENPRQLHADDHLNSLAYVARLASMTAGTEA